MLTKQEVNDLLLEPKTAKTGHIDLSKNKTVLNLYSENDDRLNFILQITKSEKIEFKLSNHLLIRPLWN